MVYNYTYIIKLGIFTFTIYEIAFCEIILLYIFYFAYIHDTENALDASKVRRISVYGINKTTTIGLHIDAAGERCKYRAPHIRCHVVGKL